MSLAYPKLDMVSYIHPQWSIIQMVSLSPLPLPFRHSSCLQAKVFIAISTPNW